jgi:hypothetical protein
MDPSPVGGARAVRLPAHVGQWPTLLWSRESDVITPRASPSEPLRSSPPRAWHRSGHGFRSWREVLAPQRDRGRRLRRWGFGVIDLANRRKGRPGKGFPR